MDRMSDTEILAAFQTLCDLTGEMKEIARMGEWEQLTLLEQRCAGVVAQLRATLPVRLPAGMQRRKVELIHKILADDAEIRLHTQPWMQRIQALLGNTDRARRVHRTYEVGRLEDL